MQHDKQNFNNVYSIQLAKYTIKNYLQLKSMYVSDMCLISYVSDMLCVCICDDT